MFLRDLIARLVGSNADSVDATLPPHVEALIPALIDLVAEEIEPNMVRLPRYRARIEPAIRRTVAFLRGAGSVLQHEAVALSPLAWSRSAEINALFATPADVTTTLAQSDALHRWFREHPDADEAYAWLTAERQERTVLGMALVGDKVQRDVMQTTLSFVQHRVVFPAPDLVSARVEFGLAIFRGLLAIVLERIETTRAQSRDLAEQQAMLKVRLRRLRQQQQSIAEPSAASHTGTPATIATLERELAQTSAELQTSKLQFSALDNYLLEVQKVLEEPTAVVSLVAVTIRVDRMGIQVGADVTGPVNDLTLTEIRGPALQRIAVLVRCKRADLPPERKADYSAYV